MGCYLGPFQAKKGEVMKYSYRHLAFHVIGTDGRMHLWMEERGEKGEKVDLCWSARLSTLEEEIASIAFEDTATLLEDAGHDDFHFEAQWEKAKSYRNAWQDGILDLQSMLTRLEAIR